MISAPAHCPYFLWISNRTRRHAHCVEIYGVMSSLCIRTIRLARLLPNGLVSTLTLPSSGDLIQVSVGGVKSSLAAIIGPGPMSIGPPRLPHRCRIRSPDRHTDALSRPKQWRGGAVGHGCPKSERPAWQPRQNTSSSWSDKRGSVG